MGLTGAPLVRQVKNAMEETGLPYALFADRETITLSGGEKRRAAIAGVLAMDSDILLLDEPAAGLDGKGREGILRIIRGRQQMGKTVIFSTHSMELAAACDLLGVMVKGRLAAFGSPRELFGPRWDPAWNMRLPWTVAAVRILEELGHDLSGAVPLNAEEFIRCILDRQAAGPAAMPVRPPLTGPPEGDPSGEAIPRNRRRRKTGLEFFRNVTIGQFLDRPSRLRSLGAGKKLLFLLACGTMTVLGDIPAISAGILGLTLISGGIAGRVGPKHLLRGVIPILPYIGIIVFFQVLFTWQNDTSQVVFSAGFFSVTLEELRRSLTLICRFMALMALVTLYCAVTPLREFLKAINRALAPLAGIGVPVRDVSLTIGIALRFVPVLTEEAESIVTAQLSRGGGYGRKGRIRAAAAMIVPLFLRTLERSENLAKAMLLRLYA
jgi:energy-coupling factor transport system ATP-binding protein